MEEGRLQHHRLELGQGYQEQKHRWQSLSLRGISEGQWQEDLIHTVTNHGSVDHSSQELVLVGCGVVFEESNGVLIAEGGSLSSDGAGCSHKGEDIEMHDCVRY